MAQITEQKGSSFFDLERQRLLLEQNVVKFREYLQNWQTWEAEYEGFKEEILALGDDHTGDDLSGTGALFGGTLLNEKEIDLLLEDKSGQQRSRDQVVGLLNRRIDYVEENIKTIENFLKRAEDQAAASLLASDTEIQDSEELPMTEIREDLNEEGNVISSSITIPKDTPPKFLDTLRKAGVELPEPHIGWTEHPKERPELETANAESSNVFKKTGEAQDQDSGSRPNKRSAIPDQHLDRPVIDKPSIHRKKSVTFAEGTKKEDASTSKRQVFPLRPKSGIHPLTRVKANNVQGTGSNHIRDAMIPKNPVAFSAIDAKSDMKTSDAQPFSAFIPTDESPKDAALRRQMIQYNMEDIGSVVAEMNLDEEDFDFETDQECDQFCSSTDEDEDEDEFGRTKRRVVGDEYRMEMLALEKKLNAGSIQNIGPEASVPELVKSSLSTEKTKTEQSNNAKQEDRKTSPTKEVRFADQLEIHGLPSFTPSRGLDETTGNAGKSQLDSPISEQATCSSDPSETLPSTKKISRFKSARNGSTLAKKEPLKPSADPIPATASKPPIASTIIERSARQPTPSPPPASLPSSTRHSPPLGPHASTIIEHPYSKSTNAPPELDDLDPSLLHQQVATEYHRMRNQMIHRQGGFLESAEEEANQGRMKLPDDGERKVSRFKAARLRMG